MFNQNYEVLKNLAVSRDKEPFWLTTLLTTIKTPENGVWIKIDFFDFLCKEMIKLLFAENIPVPASAVEETNRTSYQYFLNLKQLFENIISKMDELAFFAYVNKWAKCDNPVMMRIIKKLPVEYVFIFLVMKSDDALSNLKILGRLIRSSNPYEDCKEYLDQIGKKTKVYPYHQQIPSKEIFEKLKAESNPISKSILLNEKTFAQLYLFTVRLIESTRDVKFRLALTQANFKAAEEIMSEKQKFLTSSVTIPRKMIHEKPLSSSLDSKLTLFQHGSALEIHSIESSCESETLNASEEASLTSQGDSTSNGDFFSRDDSQESPSLPTKREKTMALLSKAEINRFYHLFHAKAKELKRIFFHLKDSEDSGQDLKPNEDKLLLFIKYHLPEIPIDPKLLTLEFNQLIIFLAVLKIEPETDYKALHQSIVDAVNPYLFYQEKLEKWDKRMERSFSIK